MNVQDNVLNIEDILAHGYNVLKLKNNDNTIYRILAFYENQIIITGEDINNYQSINIENVQRFYKEDILNDRN